jgi:DNA repair exonuclease SbcCD ATPase subunit
MSAPDQPNQPKLPAEVREAMPKPPQHLPGVSGNMAETKAEAALTPSEPPPSVAEPTSEGWTRISVPPQPSALDQLTEQAEILGLYDRASPEQVVQPGADSRRIAKEITAYLRRQYDSGYTFDENTVAPILARAFAEKDAEIEHWKSTAENLNAEFARIKDEAKQHDARAEGCLVRAERAEAERDEWQLACANWSATIGPKLNAHSLAEAETNLNALLAERDQLRAEVERLTKLHSECAAAMQWSKETISDLRAQLADEANEVQRLTEMLTVERAQLAELQRINQADYTEAGWQRARELEAQLAADDMVPKAVGDELIQLRAQLTALEASERKAHYEREDARQALELCRTELAAAQDEIEEFKNNNRYMRGHTAGYEEAKEKYESQLAAAQEDRERLDWLSNRSSKVCAIGPVVGADERWVLGGGENFFGATLRQAIDAARKEARP